ncbi:MAG: RNA-directed DNA polymerase [Halanaerobiales bacterium]|nr:RNA-directed DNA polymerase [Halanaerobiales bacterium]
MKSYEQYYLKELQDRLKNKTYQTSEYTIKEINDDGKQRTIYKLPYFPDRIAQWAIMLVIEPMLKEKLILDTYSAIPNRGIHLGLERLHKAMEDREATKYCLKMDIKKYYPSINHEILKQIYRRIFKDPNLLWLLDEIIDSTEGDVGIPIGNYISQWSGNIYLAYFDHWMKEEMKCSNYFRYMDDIVILHHNKEFLHKLKRKVDDYLKGNLKLRIKGDWQVFPTYVRGVDFLGYRSFGNYTLLRKSTTKKFKRKMRKLWEKDKLDFHDYCSINSYKGWLKWCNSYNLKQKYIEPLKNKIKEYERVNNICK